MLTRENWNEYIKVWEEDCIELTYNELCWDDFCDYTEIEEILNDIYETTHCIYFVSNEAAAEFMDIVKCEEEFDQGMFYRKCLSYWIPMEELLEEKRKQVTNLEKMVKEVKNNLRLRLVK